MFRSHTASIKKELQEEYDDQPNLYRVTGWTPMEISLVDIPADPTVGVGRSEPQTPLNQPLQETPMPQSIPQEPETQERTMPDPQMAVKQALEQEKQRRSEMRTLFDPYTDHTNLRDQCLDNPEITLDEARKLLLMKWAKHNNRHQQVSVLRLEKRIQRNSLDMPMKPLPFGLDLVTEKETKPTELFGYSLIEMARKSLELKGINTQRLDKRDLVGRAFTHSTSDFPKILENNARKAMLRGV